MVATAVRTFQAQKVAQSRFLTHQAITLKGIIFASAKLVQFFVF